MRIPIPAISARHYVVLYLFIPLLLLSAKEAVGQKSSNTIASKFEQFRKHDLQEKLFVQTNKTFYLAGEILWFKVFDINGATNAPFDFSTVAYVELLNENNVPVLQTKVSLDKDKGGSLALPLTLHSGQYTFRAYTSWMKNFSADYYFHQPVTIVNTTKGNDLPSVERTEKYTINFFPEGGNLVNGLPSTIAFKAMDPYGNPVGLEGMVIDQNKDSIVPFQSFGQGMGRFSFTPEAGNLYQAVMLAPDGRRIIEDMPVAYNQGYVLHVEETAENRIKIKVRTNVPDEQRAYLLIHTREAVKVAEAVLLSDGKAEITLSKNKLGAGISEITLFNNRQQPVCERLYFKPVTRQLNIQTQLQDNPLATRHPVNLQLHTTDETGKSISATMAVSIYKLDSLQTTETGNIFNYLWLSSELTGHVAHPSFYFQADHSRSMDDLMLTQGWRRFDWNKVLQHNAPTFQYAPELSGPVISGKVINNGRSAADALVYLAIPGKQVQLYGSQSNKTGLVYFNMKNFYGPNQIVVRTDPHSKNRQDEVRIQNPFSEKYVDARRPQFPIAPADKALLKSHHLWMQLAHTYHAKDIDKWVQPPNDTTAFYGKPRKSYLLDKYTRYVTMEEVLREYVLEVAVRKEKQHYHLKVMNDLFAFDQHMSSTLFQDNPLVLFDGVPVFDIDKVIAYDPLKVRKIEAVAGRYFYGPITADGIVSFTTYDGVLDDYTLDPRAIVLDYEGLQKQRIFYNPESDRLSSRIPDFRNALYWSPAVTTDSSGQAQCTFYTSDLPGKYVIIVNGISKAGRSGSKVAAFKVTQ